MKDIGSWLEDIGLGEHDSLFKDNHIDFEILTELSEEDFKELGLSLGHRKKILKAIQKLDNPGLPDQPGIQQARLNRANDTSQAEKRFLTVLFCDLADSTRLTAALDNEDMHDLNRAYQSTCTDAILRNQGYVARYMGDGVLAYFGYPETNEDDAERAVVAGLDIVREIDSLARSVQSP